MKRIETKCPTCKKNIITPTIRCKHCNEWLDLNHFARFLANKGTDIFMRAWVENLSEEKAKGNLPNANLEVAETELWILFGFATMCGYMVPCPQIPKALGGLLHKEIYKSSLVLQKLYTLEEFMEVVNRRRRENGNAEFKVSLPSWLSDGATRGLKTASAFIAHTVINSNLEPYEKYSNELEKNFFSAVREHIATATKELLYRS